MKQLILTLLLVTNYGFAGTEILITGNSSEKFQLKAEYGYRAESSGGLFDLECKDFNPWNPGGKYVEEVVKAKDLGNGKYELILKPEDHKEPGKCEWSLVSLNLEITPKNQLSGKIVNDATIVIRDFNPSGVNGDETHLSEFKSGNCQVLKYDKPTGGKKYTHYVSCSAGNGETIEFTQSTVETDLDQTIILDLE